MNIKITDSGLLFGDGTSGYQTMATQSWVQDYLTVEMTPSDIGAAPAAHAHSATDITSGILSMARLPTGTTASTVALGNHTHSDYISKSATGIQNLAGDLIASGLIIAGDENASTSGYAGLFGNSNLPCVEVCDLSGNSADFRTTSISVSLANQQTPTTLTFPVAAKSGTIATSVDIAGCAASSHTHTASNVTDLGDSATKNVGTSSGTVAAGDHTHSDYVSKTWTGENQVMKGGLQMQGNANSIAYIDLDFPSSSGQDPYVGVYNGSTGNETLIYPGSIKWRPNPQTLFTQLTYPSDAKSGVIATDTGVNAAISTINTNFTNIQTMLTLKSESNISVGSRASGWSFSSDGETWDNKLKFFHWGHIAYLSGSAKCSSALTANSMTTSIGTMSLPSGYTLIGANAGIPGGEYWFWSSAAGVMGFRTFVAKSANSSLAIRLIFVLHTIDNKYTKTTVANI